MSNKTEGFLDNLGFAFVLGLIGFVVFLARDTTIVIFIAVAAFVWAVSRILSDRATKPQRDAEAAEFARVSTEAQASINESVGRIRVAVGQEPPTQADLDRRVAEVAGLLGDLPSRSPALTDDAVEVWKNARQLNLDLAELYGGWLGENRGKAEARTPEMEAFEVAYMGIHRMAFENEPPKTIEEIKAYAADVRAAHQAWVTAQAGA